MIADTKLQITKSGQAKEQNAKEKYPSDCIEDLARLREVKADAKRYVNGSMVKVVSPNSLNITPIRKSKPNHLNMILGVERFWQGMGQKLATTKDRLDKKHRKVSNFIVTFCFELAY